MALSALVTFSPYVFFALVAMLFGFIMALYIFTRLGGEPFEESESWELAAEAAGGGETPAPGGVWSGQSLDTRDVAEPREDAIIGTAVDPAAAVRAPAGLASAPDTPPLPQTAPARRAPSVRRASGATPKKTASGASRGGATGTASKRGSTASKRGSAKGSARGSGKSSRRT